MKIEDIKKNYPLAWEAFENNPMYLPMFNELELLIFLDSQNIKCVWGTEGYIEIETEDDYFIYEDSGEWFDSDSVVCAISDSEAIEDRKKAYGILIKKGFQILNEKLTKEQC